MTSLKALLDLMANTPSALKHIRQTKKLTVRNSAIKSRVKATVKKVRLAVSNKNDAGEPLSRAFKTIDKAVSKGIIKKSTANRKKSRLAHLAHQAAKA